MKTNDNSSGFIIREALNGTNNISASSWTRNDAYCGKFLCAGNLLFVEFLLKSIDVLVARWLFHVVKMENRFYSKERLYFMIRVLKCWMKW